MPTSGDLKSGDSLFFTGHQNFLKMADLGGHSIVISSSF